MQNNFPKIPLFLSAIFFCIFLIVFLFFYRGIKNNNQESQLKESQWHSETLRRNEIKALDRSVRMVETEREQLDTHFAQSSDIVPFLDTIEGLAKEVGVKAEVTSVEILTDHNGLMIGMQASGIFSGLYKFLTLLENSPYELEFVEMDMHRETEITEGKSATLSKWGAIFKIKLLSFME